MSDVVIKVENLSRQYRPGNVGAGPIGHDLNRWWQIPFVAKKAHIKK